MIILMTYYYLVNVVLGHNTQHCLLVMLEKFKEYMDKGNKSGALLTNLSKVYDWYGVSRLSFSLIFC